MSNDIFFFETEIQHRKPEYTSFNVNKPTCEQWTAFIWYKHTVWPYNETKKMVEFLFPGKLKKWKVPCRTTEKVGTVFRGGYTDSHTTTQDVNVAGFFVHHFYVYQCRQFVPSTCNVRLANKLFVTKNVGWDSHAVRHFSMFSARVDRTGGEKFSKVFGKVEIHPYWPPRQKKFSMASILRQAVQAGDKNVNIFW